jgi:hypothetical protein
MKAVLYILISASVLLLYATFAKAQNFDELFTLPSIEKLGILQLDIDSLKNSLKDLIIFEDFDSNKTNYSMLIFPLDKKINYTMEIIKPDLTKDYTMKIIPTNPIKPNNKGFKKFIPKKKELPE